MSKIILILFLFFTLTGCSALRRSVDPGIGTPAKSTVTTGEIWDNNLTQDNFYIQKAEIELDSENISGKFNATVKFRLPGEYLVSLRTRSGLEVARIYMNPDTVMVNDRFNSVLYTGKPELLARKFGVSFELLPVIFGDFVAEKEKLKETLECDSGHASKSAWLKGTRLLYRIDCRSGKVVSLNQEGNLNNSVNELEFLEFMKAGTTVIPGVIKIGNETSGAEIIIRIIRVEQPWDGTIEFIPGRNYEISEIR